MVTIGIDSARDTLWQPRAMPPIDLNVPFYEKDDAKRMGTRLDAARKTWFLFQDSLRSRSKGEERIGGQRWG
jgi:hypothetical protein